MLPNISAVSFTEAFPVSLLMSSETLSNSCNFCAWIWRRSGDQSAELIKYISCIKYNDRRARCLLFRVLMKLTVKRPVKACLLLEDSDLRCATVLLGHCFPVL
jgi:hypothetical protein